MVSLQQESEVLAEVHDMHILTLLVTALVAVLMTALIWLVAKRTVAPIQRMTATAVEIGNGHLKQRIAEDRQDELGTLAKAFNKMVGQLEDSYHRVEQQRTQAETQVTRLSLAVEQSTASVAIIDPQSKIEYVNPRFTKVTGYSAEEAIGRDIRDLKAGFHPAEFYEGMQAILNSGREWRGQLCNRKKNGELFWELTSISPIRNARDEVTSFVVIEEDISEHKRMEEEIASLARFPSDNPNPVLRLDHDGNIQYGNDASAQLLESWRCRVGNPVPARWRQLVLDSLASGRTQQAECECGRRYSC